MQFDTQTIAQILHTNCKQNVVCKSIQTDSRKALDGAVFLALIGDNFDG
ncbi:MAG: UDP-N-acetylmuramoyl-tripeptide--D-alanyl-D-alanine ligase, partial [Candidatus Thioglobus sp.]|nr:UDP-N-acetylmuramoyl-tripeptide--D-alanyl-D-alanine ligase [Candidatus Thioglobus sp.]